jgi:tRNA A-37 threonylcarbamoyl transferase component Bud32
MAHPQKISHYEIKGEIGRGGMATVYRAFDARFKRDVAIKLMAREFNHDLTFRTRFEREAQTIASLEHSAIVPVYDFGEEDDQPYLVMSYMPGGSLLDRIEAGSLELADIGTILQRVGAALDAAHGQGVIHRDVKPANILFDKHGDAYLSDFGIVKVSEATSQLSGSAVIGTPAFMAPEMAKKDGLTPLVDVYGLGVTLYHMLTGALPFEAPTLMGMLMAHLSEPIPNVREARPDLPGAMQDVINRALAKDPRQRYQSASALSADVQAAIAGKALAAGFSTMPVAAIKEPPSAEVPASTVVLPRGDSRRMPPWAWGSAALIPVIVVAAALVPRLLDRGEQTPAVPTATTADPGEQTPALSTPTPTLPTAISTADLGEHVVAEWRDGVNLPNRAAFGFGSVWVANHRSPSTMMRIDPVSNTVIAVIEDTGERAHDILITDDAVWVSGEFDDTSRVDPETNTVIAKVPGANTSLAGGFGSIWAAARTDAVDRIDPATNTVSLSIPFGDIIVNCNNVVFTTSAAVWVYHCDEKALIKIDPATNRVVSNTPVQELVDSVSPQAQIPSGKGTDFIWLWQEAGLLRLDQTTGEALTFLPLSQGMLCDDGIAATEDAVWLAGDGQISKLDLATNQIIVTYQLSMPGCAALSIGFDALWVVYRFDNVAQRLDLIP